MGLFAWDDQLSVGHPMIDADHKKLIKLVNDFHEAMDLGRGNDAIGKVLNDLVIYTKEHFRREEDEMQRIKFSKITAHQLEHDKLIKELDELQDEFLAGKRMLTLSVSKFLFNWLFVHIIQTDKLLADAIQEAK